MPDKYRLKLRFPGMPDEQYQKHRLLLAQADNATQKVPKRPGRTSAAGKAKA